jgi:hypothetical protein
MAELNTATRTKIAQAAGLKAAPSAMNPERRIFIDTPAVWSAANGDTAGTAMVIPAGSRLVPGVSLSTAAGAASSTMSIGLRDANTLVVIDATAVMAATSLTAAQNASVFTGTKSTNGQYYTLPVDCELFLTFAGAAPTANQAVSAMVGFISP